ncbi:MAG TPA: class I SAM-dependent methyltransferase [Woeseiaceae bacterium]|nr:class I SAM-dependent methyltransferase [Woeseiaceae bacterium]
MQTTSSIKSNEPVKLPTRRSETLSARIEPFDSYWQAPEDIEAGYSSFAQYYLHNYLGNLPENRNCEILVISCGPGYLVDLLKTKGYHNVLGIDSDADKIAYAQKRGLNCRTERAFEHLEGLEKQYDVIVPEQELNHLTHAETLEFLALCHKALRDGGLLVVYGLNGANPLVGSENLAHNIDHFYTMTEYSLNQMLEYAKFREIRMHPLKLYVFWKNPLNYVGLAVTSVLHLCMRAVFILYGKKVTILTKKIMATCRK